MCERMFPTTERFNQVLDARVRLADTLTQLCDMARLGVITSDQFMVQTEDAMVQYRIGTRQPRRKSSIPCECVPIGPDDLVRIANYV